MNILELMGAPFAECLVLVAIHTYLGIHVLKRRVIFVDLALAQIAALGTTVGFLVGILPETSASLVFSMSFTFIGAAIFALTRIKGDKVPQEAVIGLVYAISCAIAVLVVEKTQGAEHLKDILVGNILWVSWRDVGIAAAAYLAVGVVHYLLHERFFAISEDPDKAAASGMHVRAWDFLFYLTFGFVISFSTRVAGVLLVFVFLVAPAIMAFMLTNRLLYQLLIGWGTGTVVTVIGLYLSYAVDLPSGPTVVAFYGVALAVSALGVYIIRAANRPRAALKVLGGSAVAVVVVGLVYGEGRLLSTSALANSVEQNNVAASVARDKATVRSRTSSKWSRRKDTLLAATNRCVGNGKIDRYAKLPDAHARLELVEQKLKENKRRGLGFLLILLSDPDTPSFFRAEGVALLEQAVGDKHDYDAEQTPTQNATALAAICARLTGLKKQP